MSAGPTREKIVRLGHRGDGETSAGVFVPGTAPGDVVAVEIDGDRGRLVELIIPGPDRVPAVCGHFGTCGGCALQHLRQDACLGWKHDMVVQALEQRGITGIEVADVVPVPPRTRRRAVLTARHMREGVIIGFQERGTNFIVDMAECHVIHPDLFALVAPLRTELAEILPEHERAEVDITRTDTGIDMALGLPRLEIEAALRVRLAAMSARLRLARLTVNGELVAQDHAPVINWGGVGVTPPAGGFLQAVPEAEAVMQDLVAAGIGRAKRVVDLFCGAGAFTFVLARTASVSAYDSEAAAIAALTNALKGAQGIRPVAAERRDLFRRPLLAAELDAFGAAVIDPPRAGAKAQCQQLAASKLERVVSVSCNTGTFARDARILMDGGFTLRRVTPIDQFLWSPHIELVALFERR